MSEEGISALKEYFVGAGYNCDVQKMQNIITEFEDMIPLSQVPAICTLIAIAASREETDSVKFSEAITNVLKTGEYGWISFCHCLWAIKKREGDIKDE